VRLPPLFRMSSKYDWRFSDSKLNLLALIAANIFFTAWIIPWQGSAVSTLPKWILILVSLSLMLINVSERFANTTRYVTVIFYAAIFSALIAWFQFFKFDQLLPIVIAEQANGHVYANLYQRNQLATLLVVGCLLLGHKYDAQSCKKHTLVGLLVLLAFGIIASGSRTGILQFFVMLLWHTIFVLRKNKCKFFLNASLALIAFSIASVQVLTSSIRHEETFLLDRFTQIGAYSRIELWRNVLELVAKSPLFGHGWLSLAYMHYSTDFSGARFMEMLDNAHNLPLHLAVELGIPVALGFCALVFGLIWKYKPWAETCADRQLAWGILLVIGIHSMVEYPLWYGPFFMTMVIAVGILCADGWRAWLLAQTQDAQRTVLWGIRGFAVLLLAGTAFAAFDYHRVSQIYLQPEERSAWYRADPLGAAKKSVLFQSHAKFAELQITPLTRETAPRILALSSELVMWSPEPRIIEKLIESAVMLQADDIAAFHIKRYKIAYPQAYALWSDRNR
jgi:O-antigen ligase